jgi:hypothetical protein
MLKCVGFVAEQITLQAGGKSFDHQGTGFFVSVPSEAKFPKGQGAFYLMFVTAAHVARDLAGSTVALIVNKKGGGVTVITEAAKTWYTHPDPTVDAAVVPVNWNSDMDIMAIPVEYFVRQPLKIGQGIGVGDEVYMPGLFSYAPGEKRTMPIVRHGNLAMIPDQPIQIDSGWAEVYLMEARSIGGISGSPVFIRPTQSVAIGNQHVHGITGHNVLLGLAHGHWDIKESDINSPNPIPVRVGGVNMGIGVIVPAHKILEIIYSADLVAMRREADEAGRFQEIPRPDGE